jgi:hypothetical protein
VGPEVIKAIKTAAIAEDKTSSELMEEAAEDWSGEARRRRRPDGNLLSSKQVLEF